MRRKIKVMHMIWSMGDGGAQQVVINYLRDFNNDPDIEFKKFLTQHSFPFSLKMQDFQIHEKTINNINNTRIN